MCSSTAWKRSRSPVSSSARPPASASPRAKENITSSASSSLAALHRPAEARQQLRGELPLPRELRGHRVAVGVVGRIQLHAVGSLLGPQARRHRTGRPRFDRREQRVHRAQERIHRPALAVHDRFRQREECAVQQPRHIGDQQRGGTGSVEGMGSCGGRQAAIRDGAGTWPGRDVPRSDLRGVVPPPSPALGPAGGRAAFGPRRPVGGEVAVGEPLPGEVVRPAGRSRRGVASGATPAGVV